MGLLDSYGGELPDLLPDVGQQKQPDPDAQLKGSLRTAQYFKPEELAADFTLGKKVGLAPDFVAAERQMVRQKVEEDDAAKLFSGAPLARNFLAQKPTTLALTQDDLYNVVGLESLLTRSSQKDPDPVNQMTGLDWLSASAKRAIEAGNIQNQIAYLQMGPQTPETAKRIAELKANTPKEPSVNGWLETGWVSGMKMAPQLWETFKQAQYRGAQGALLGGTAGAIGGLGFGAIPGAVAGYTAGAITGAAETSYTLEGGGAKDEFKDIRDENGQPLDPGAVDLAANGVGVVNAGIELLQIGGLIKSVPGGQKLLSFVSKDAVKEALKSVTVRQALTGLGRAYATGVITETGQEIAQETVTVLGGELAKMGSEGNFESITPTQFWERISETAYQSATAFSLMMAPGSAMKIRGEVKAARQSQIDANFFQALDDNVAASKLRERLPEAHAELVEAIRAEGGTPEAVYVEAAKLREAVGLEGETFNQLLADIGVDADEFVRAEELQADVAIPFSQYASRVAGTALSQKLREDVKFSADGMSQRQAKEFEQGYQERVQTAMAEQQANQEQNDAEMQAVVGEYTQELQRLGMSKADADASLQPLVKGASVAAARWTAIKGETVTPAQWLRDVRNLQVRAVERGQNADGTLNQDHPALAGVDMNDAAQVSEAQKLWAEMGVESPYFKKWFGNSKVVDAQGKPLTVYHGTPDNRGIYEEGFGTLGERLNNLERRGPYFFTDNKRVADTYADDRRAFDHQGANPETLATYIKMANPLRVDVAGASFRGVSKEAILAAIENGAPKDNWTRELARISPERDSITTDMLGSIAQRFGYDGVVVQNVKDNYTGTGPNSNVYMVFGNTNIKSATGNRGTFDASDPRILMQTAWHGSPYRGITKMSLDHVGSGEGAQAYGYGLYFASRREVAEWYRQKLANPRELGWYIEFQEEDNAWFVYTADDEVVDSFASEQEAEAFLDREGNKGQLYEVTIPDDDTMLDWDKPLSEQPEQVKKALLTNVFSVRTTKNDTSWGAYWDMRSLPGVSEGTVELKGGKYRAFALDGSWNAGTFKSESAALRVAEKKMQEQFLSKTGEKFYQSLKNGNYRAASEYLKSIGIPGLRYLDGTSRGKGEGHHNYVIFDDAQIAIDKTYYQDATQTPEFKKWFGDSKVVDAQGNPLVVYHGSNKKFASFNPRKRGASSRQPDAREGFFFSSSEYVADVYAEAGADEYGGKPNKYPVYLSLKNPLDVPAGGQTIVNAIKRAKSEGRDGVILRNDRDGGDIADTYIAFDPTQIKSAENRGTFDPGDPRILYAGVPQGARGSITFSDNETLIRLFKGSANFSTMLHETAHLFVNDMEAMVATGKAPEQVVKDLEALKIYAGDLATVKSQEKLAKSFEAYLREGKAPSAELRSAFSRFRAWLTAIYKDVRAQLGVELNDEVRGVFDRMLAAEDEINKAESSYATEGVVFEMLTPAEQKRIKELKGRSHEDALEKRTQRYVAAYMKALGGKKAFEAQALAEIEAMPVYKTIKAITDEGGLPPAEFDERFGQEFRLEMALKFPGVVNTKDGSVFGAFDMDMIAMAYGYSKADEMIADFQMAKTKGQAVADLIAQKIQAEETKIREQIAGETADEDVHNEPALEKLVLEAKALERKIARTAEAKAALNRGLNSTAMREVARGVLAEMPVAQAMRYDRHAAAERRAGIEAERAIKKGKWEDALAAKQREALNHALVMEAVKLREKVAKDIKRSLKVARSQSMDFTAKEHVLDLVQVYKLGTESMAPARPEELGTLADYFNTVYAEDEFGLNPLQFFSPWVLNKENAGSYKALTVNQFNELNAVIMALADAGGSEFARMVSENDKTRQEKVDELVAAILTSGYDTKKFDKGTTKQRATTAYRDVLASLQKMPDLFRNADGNVDATAKTSAKMGPNQAFAERIFRATVKMLEMLYAHKELREIEAQKLDFAKRFKKQFGERVAAINGVTVSPVRQAEGMFTWTAESVWSLALNMGNEGNLRTLMQGDGFTEQQLTALTSILSEGDWQHIQKTWDIMGRYYSETDKVFRQVYGFPMPNKVAALPLTVRTAEGGSLNLPGGYFPIRVDAELNPDIGAKQEQDLLKGDPRNKFTAVVAKGHTKERMGTSRPVTLSYEVAHRALHDQAKFIALAPVIKDARAIFSNLQYRRAMVDAFGKDAFDEIMPWLKNIANPTIERADSFDSALNKMRHLSTLYILGLNIKSSTKQYLGLAGAANKLGARWTASGLAEMAKFGGMGVDFVNEQSAFMKNRDEGLNPELAEINAKARGKGFRIFGIKTGLSKKQAVDAVMVLTRLADRHVTYSVWLGAFKRGQAEGMSHQESVEYGDRMVRRTQMSGSPVDTTGWQRDEGGKRFLTMFMSEAIPKSSRMRSDFNAYKNGKMSAAQYARSLFYESIAPAVGYTGLMFLVGAASPDDWWKEMFWQVYNETIGTYPLLGSLYSAVELGQTKQSVPGLTGIELALKLAKNGGKLGGSSEDNAKFFKALVDAMAYIHGVGNLRRVYETAAEGWKDIDRDKTVNPFRLFFKKPKD